MSEIATFFAQAVIIVGLVALGVMGLSLFFKWLPRLGLAQSRQP